MNIHIKHENKLWRKKRREDGTWNLESCWSVTPTGLKLGCKGRVEAIAASLLWFSSPSSFRFPIPLSCFSLTISLFRLSNVRLKCPKITSRRFDWKKIVYLFIFIFYSRKKIVKQRKIVGTDMRVPCTRSITKIH